jgi:hypothetical protein
MEIVRYRPGEAIQWLKVGAENVRKQAAEKGKGVFEQAGTEQRPVYENLFTAAGALFNLGRSAYAELKHKLAEASEYVLQDEHFDVVHANSIKSIRYRQIAAVKVKGDKATVVLEKGHLTIKPFAYIVSGSVKAPVGWTRNGIEVPYELLIEELAARSGVNLETS